VTQQLSNLADGLVRACLDLAIGQSGLSADGFVVIAMGKHGAEELNYSSDIDLLFVRPCPDEKLKLGQHLIDNVGRVTPEGFSTASICACVHEGTVSRHHMEGCSIHSNMRVVGKASPSQSVHWAMCLLKNCSRRVTSLLMRKCAPVDEAAHRTGSTAKGT
jgi:hypothetical protein